MQKQGVRPPPSEGLFPAEGHHEQKEENDGFFYTCAREECLSTANILGGYQYSVLDTAECCMPPSDDLSDKCQEYCQLHLRV